MTDIVERLSRIANATANDDPGDIVAVAQDAIAEIMRLRHIIEQHQAAMQMSMDAGLLSSNPGGFREIKDGLKR